MTNLEESLFCLHPDETPRLDFPSSSDLKRHCEREHGEAYIVPANLADLRLTTAQARAYSGDFFPAGWRICPAKESDEDGLNYASRRMHLLQKLQEASGVGFFENRDRIAIRSLTDKPYHTVSLLLCSKVSHNFFYQKFIINLPFLL